MVSKFMQGRPSNDKHMDSQVSMDKQEACKDMSEYCCYTDRKEVIDTDSSSTPFKKFHHVSRCYACHPHHCSDSNSSSPEIGPIDTVFHTFAPAPDDMITSPLCKKFYDEFRSSVSRLLTPESSFKKLVDLGDKDKGIESVTDIWILNLVYKTILEVILTQQSEDVLVHLSKMEVYLDGAWTPCMLKEIADEESCPDAPMKTRRTPIKIDKEICRKIEF